MPEMSADVEHPNVSLTAVGTPAAPATSPRHGDAVAPVHATAKSNGDGGVPLPTPDPTLPLATTPIHTDAPRWRLTVTGYALLLAGFTLALTIPQFRLRAGVREEAMVLLSIATMVTGAAVVVASFLLNILRQN